MADFLAGLAKNAQAGDATLTQYHRIVRSVGPATSHPASTSHHAPPEERTPARDPWNRAAGRHPATGAARSGKEHHGQPPRPPTQDPCGPPYVVVVTQPGDDPVQDADPGGMRGDALAQADDHHPAPPAAIGLDRRPGGKGGVEPVEHRLVGRPRAPAWVCSPAPSALVRVTRVVGALARAFLTSSSRAWTEVIMRPRWSGQRAPRLGVLEGRAQQSGAGRPLGPQALAPRARMAAGAALRGDSRTREPGAPPRRPRPRGLGAGDVPGGG
jgi:hypothetical protein